MALNKNLLEENLNQLIQLYQTFKEKNNPQSNIMIDDTILSNLENATYKYKNLKIELPKEYLNQLLEPIDNIVKHLINQLRNELENDIDDDIKDLKEDLVEVDFLLKDPFLSDTEINELLDRRAELLVLIKNNT